MPPHFGDPVVSPELVLVDPGLRARARAAMVVPHWAPSSTPEPPPEPEVVEPEPELPSRRTRLAAPVGTLVATAAASLLLTAVTDRAPASGEPAAVAATPARSVASVAASPSDGDAPSTQAGTTSTSYELELVRDGKVVYTAKARSPRAAVPRTWSHDGTEYADRKSVVEGKR